MSELNIPDKQKGVLEIHSIVETTYRQIKEILLSSVKDLPEKQRWLVIARVVNILVSHFYEPIIKHTQDRGGQKDE